MKAIRMGAFGRESGRAGINASCLSSVSMPFCWIRGWMEVRCVSLNMEVYG